MALKYGPVEVVSTPKPMRFEYKDSFTLFHLENRVCEGSIMATRKKNYVLRPIAAENLRFIMATSEMIENCGSFNWVGCPPQAAYCEFIPADDLVDLINSKNALFRQLPCLDELYLYLYPENTNERSLLVLYAEKTPKNCMEARKNFCAEQTFEECRTDSVSNCAAVECFSHNRRTRGLCLANTTSESAYAACNADAEWALDSAHDMNVRVLEAPESYSIGYILLGIIFLGLLGTCCSSLYYRYRLKTDGFAPFSPPSFCPLFLFPLPEYLEADYASINNGMVPLRILRTAE